MPAFQVLDDLLDQWELEVRCLLMVQKSQGQPPEMFFNPINNGINYLPTGAGFQSSTVEPNQKSPKKKHGEISREF